MALLIGGLAVYPFFLVPTLIPGVILSLSALLYLLAALRREPTLSSDDLAKAREGRGEGEGTHLLWRCAGGQGAVAQNVKPLYGGGGVCARGPRGAALRTR